MLMTISVLLVLQLAAGGSPGAAVGVAAASGPQHCAALPAADLAAGSPVTLVGLEPPEQAFRAVVEHPLVECAALVTRGIRGPYYALVPEAESQPLPDLAIALAGRIDARASPDGLAIRLGAEHPDAHVRSCASSEGLHLTLWAGRPLASARLWHAYWYLGYDLEPDCEPADYGDDGEGGGR